MKFAFDNCSLREHCSPQSIFRSTDINDQIATSGWSRQPPKIEQSPRRAPPNAELRTREYLTEAEVERLIEGRQG